MEEILKPSVSNVGVCSKCGVGAVSKCCNGTTPSNDAE